MLPSGGVLVVAMHGNGDIAFVEGANVGSGPVVQQYDFVIIG